MSVSDKSRSPRQRPPASTPEAREAQLVSLAVDLAEKQLADGTASAAVLSHYLKLATPRERLERKKIESENELLRAKVEALGSMQRQEELYAEAMQAFTEYRGGGDKG